MKHIQSSNCLKTKKNLIYNCKDKLYGNKKEEQEKKSLEKRNFKNTLKTNIKFEGSSGFFERNERHIRMLQKRQIEYEKLKKMKEEEKVDYDFKPHINSDNHLNRTIDDLFKWKEQLNKKNEKQRKEKEGIATKSVERIIGRQVHTEERWIELQRKKNTKSVSPVQANRKNVCNRLYDYNKIYEKKRKDRELKLYSGMFQPQITRYNKKQLDASINSNTASLIKNNKTKKISPSFKCNKLKQLYSPKSNKLLDYNKEQCLENKIKHNDNFSKLSTSQDIIKKKSKQPTFVKLKTFEPSDSINTQNRNNIFELENKNFGTQTSQTFFNENQYADSYKDVTKFINDKPSFLNTVIDNYFDSFNQANN